MPAFNTQQPALSLNESLALFGIFPSFGGGGGGGMTMAMFHTYAFGYSPGGSATANGQLLPINQSWGPCEEYVSSLEVWNSAVRGRDVD